QLGANGRPVTNAEVASIVGLHPSTTSIANAFFTDVGLLVRAADGQVPAQEVVNFAKAHQWDPDKAPTKLAPLLASTWFGLALFPKVQFRAHSPQEALGILAEAAGASTEHRGQLESMLELLAFAGLLHVDGDSVRPVRA